MTLGRFERPSDHPGVDDCAVAKKTWQQPSGRHGVGEGEHHLPSPQIDQDGGLLIIPLGTQAGRTVPDHSAMGRFESIGRRYLCDNSRHDHVHAAVRSHKRTGGAPRQGVDGRKNYFPSPAHRQGCTSLAGRCPREVMANGIRAMPIRVTCPPRRGGWHIPIADSNTVNTPPQNGSDIGPSSIPRSRGWRCRTTPRCVRGGPAVTPASLRVYVPFPGVLTLSYRLFRIESCYTSSTMKHDQEGGPQRCVWTCTS
jgi:hypothetical protein